MGSYCADYNYGALGLSYQTSVADGKLVPNICCAMRSHSPFFRLGCVRIVAAQIRFYLRSSAANIPLHVER